MSHVCYNIYYTLILKLRKINSTKEKCTPEVQNVAHSGKEAAMQEHRRHRFDP